MPASVSRRNLAKGAAWAAPAVLATSAIPAYAASSDEPYGSICRLYFAGGNVNAQRTDIYLSVVSPTGVIKAGQTVTWSINAPAANGAPTGNYAQDGGWAITSSGSAPNFTVTLTTTRDVPVSEVNCVARLIWDSSPSASSSAVKPKSQVTVTSASPNGSGSYSLSLTIPQRYGTRVNDPRRSPVIINGSCYPTIQWSNLGASTTRNKDNILRFNGKDILPDSNAGNNQLITTGTC